MTMIRNTTEGTLRYQKPNVYAVKHKNDAERIKSQSGGMFAILSDWFLNHGSVVYGCSFDGKFKAIHMRACNATERDRMRYSKYVQSDMQDTFRAVLADLKEGRDVLFSGTSCQVAGLKRYIEMSDGRLLGSLMTVDVVCHGVPSPKVWREYLAWEESRNHSEITSVVCRDKRKYGWKSHVVTIELKNGRKIESRVFPRIFYSHRALRPSCYRCPYKDIVHPSDITIADCWGIEREDPGFADSKGVSLVLINTSRGQELFSKCSPMYICKEKKIEDYLQKPLVAPYDPPRDRSSFWGDFETTSFKNIAKKYGGNSIIKNIRWKTKLALRRVLKKMQ